MLNTFVSKLRSAHIRRTRVCSLPIFIGHTPMYSLQLNLTDHMAGCRQVTQSHNGSVVFRHRIVSHVFLCVRLCVIDMMIHRVCVCVSKRAYCIPK